MSRPATADRVHIEHTATLTDERSYCGWPTVATRGDGRLMLVYSGGREGHVCPYGQVHWRTSRDHGQTWSSTRVLADGPLDDRDAGVIETRQGTILVNWFTSVAWVRELNAGHPDIPDPAKWRRVEAALADEVVDAELGTWAIRSEDGGQTWSERIDTVVNSPHGPAQLADGRLLFVGSKRIEAGQRTAKGAPFTTIGIAESHDDGRSWQWIGDLPTSPGDDPALYHEPHAVEASPGRIVVLMRNHNPQYDGQLLQSDSNDGGYTWSTPRPIGVWGYPPHLLRLKDGRLLASYGHRREPIGIRVMLSDDEGQSWSNPVAIYEDASHRDMGYPTTAEWDSAKFLTTWYERRQSHAVIRQTRWTFGV